MMPWNAGPDDTDRAGLLDRAPSSLLLDRASTTLSHLQHWQVRTLSGWQFLLPPPPCERLICYDSLGGAASLLTARLAREVLVVHHDPTELERLRAVAAAGGAGSVSFALAGEDLPGGRGFDGAVVHDPEARILRRDHGAAPSLDVLCSRLVAALRPRGFLYLGLANRFSYRRLGWLTGAPPRLLSVTAATRAVQRAGLSTVASHPFLMDGQLISEIVPPPRYRSAKNPFLIAERARKLLLQGWGRRHLAPAYGVVGHRGTPGPSWLDQIVADPWVQGQAPGSALRRCLVLNGGRLILSLGPVHASHGSLALVVTTDTPSAEARRAEGAWLRRLAALPAETAGVIPVFYGERELAHVRVFALSERPGTTVDHDTPLLPELTARAAQWLRGFHRATARPAKVDAGVYSEAIAPLFAAARQRNRALSKAIDALEERVSSRAMGLTLQLGCMHGDFKLENVVFDETSRAVQGVIDWELAWEPGPPLLDLVYLLVYNRVIREGTGSMGIIDASMATLVRQEWTPDERALLDAHHAACGTSRELETMLGAVFLVHHLGARITHNLADERVLALLSRLLLALCDRLATIGVP